MSGRLVQLILLFCGQRLYIKLMKQISAVLQERWQGVLFKLGQALFHVVIWVEVLNPFIICFAHMLAEFLDTCEQFGHAVDLFVVAAGKLRSPLGPDGAHYFFKDAERHSLLLQFAIYDVFGSIFRTLFRQTGSIFVLFQVKTIE
jgi:hypothetical protein